MLCQIISSLFWWPWPHEARFSKVNSDQLCICGGDGAGCGKEMFSFPRQAKTQEEKRMIAKNSTKKTVSLLTKSVNFFPKRTQHIDLESEG